jgi:hypothetical protein
MGITCRQRSALVELYAPRPGHDRMCTEAAGTLSANGFSCKSLTVVDAAGTGRATDRHADARKPLAGSGERSELEPGMIARGAKHCAAAGPTRLQNCDCGAPTRGTFISEHLYV